MLEIGFLKSDGLADAEQFLSPPGLNSSEFSLLRGGGGSGGRGVTGLYCPLSV